MDFTRTLDFLSGKQVYKFYEFYEETQWFTLTQLNELKIQKLRKLLDHCYKNVPFYSKHMKKIGLIPSDSIDLSILDEFPIITKEKLKENYVDFTPTNLSQIRGVKSGTTGGTTGNILVARDDANSRSSIWGAFKRFENWMSFRTGDRALILMGGHVINKRGFDSLVSNFKSNILQILMNQMTFNPYDTSEGNKVEIVAAIQSNKFKLIRGYSQYLFMLCKYIEHLGKAFNIPSITTTAEPLMQEHREIYKRILGADAFDQYGCGEIGGIAFECDQHEGLHITEERVVIELLDSNDLVITDLDNFAMPFIRYWNADQAIISKNKCSCGREHQLIEKVLGRTCDYIKGVNGEYLHWAYFWHLVFDSGISTNNDLLKFQVVQKSNDLLEFHYVAREFSLTEKELLCKNIQQHTGGLKVEFIRQEKIENSKSGKYRPIINETIS